MKRPTAWYICGICGLTRKRGALVMRNGMMQCRTHKLPAHMYQPVPFLPEK